MVTEPQTDSAWQAILASVVNTVIGCVAGVLVLLAAGPVPWVLPLAVTVTALVCPYLVRTPQARRVGPVTAALVPAAGVAATRGRPG